MNERRLGALTSVRAPLRVVPEYRTIQVDTGEEILELAAYPKGDGCPLTVVLAEANAYAEWNDAIPTDADRAAMTPRRYASAVNKAEYLWRRDLLTAVIPGLDEDQAGLLVGDDGPWRAILEELGWLDPLPTASDVQEADADPEAQPQPETTGETASPDSAPTTAATTP